MTNVQYRTECEQAATSLGLEDTYAYWFNFSWIPHGCGYKKHLYWHSPDGSNPSVECGATYSCICRAAVGKQIF